MKAKQKTSLKDMKQARTHMIFLSSSHTNRLTNPIKMFSKTIENQILAANNKHYMYHHETTQIHECIQQDPTKPSVLNGAFFTKEMESRLTTFFFIVPLPLDSGTGCSI